MKIGEYIKSSLDASDRRELDQAMLFACLAVDGTAKRMYPDIKKVGDRFRKFITEHLDIIELMHGGLNLQETVFPFPDNKGNIGIKFEDIIYEKFRCSLAHGDELPDGYGASWQDWKASTHKYSFYVFETYPFISVLDIYYETSSAGLLKDLNDKILASAGAAPTNIVISSNTFDESDASATTVGTLTAKESDGDDVAPGATFVINSITDGLGGDRTGEFAISGSSLNTNTTYRFQFRDISDLNGNILERF